MNRGNDLYPKMPPQPVLFVFGGEMEMKPGANKIQPGNGINGRYLTGGMSEINFLIHMAGSNPAQQISSY
jgi:hypothetical protein